LKYLGYLVAGAKAYDPAWEIDTKKKVSRTQPSGRVRTRGVFFSSASPSAVVVEERADGARLHLTVAVWPPLRADEAERVAEGCPESVAGTGESVG
jgi:hypothetical protein